MVRTRHDVAASKTRPAVSLQWLLLEELPLDEAVQSHIRIKTFPAERCQPHDPAAVPGLCLRPQKSVGTRPYPRGGCRYRWV